MYLLKPMRKEGTDACLIAHRASFMASKKGTHHLLCLASIVATAAANTLSTKAPRGNAYMCEVTHMLQPWTYHGFHMHGWSAHTHTVHETRYIDYKPQTTTIFLVKSTSFLICAWHEWDELKVARHTHKSTYILNFIQSLIFTKPSLKVSVYLRLREGSSAPQGVIQRGMSVPDINSQKPTTQNCRNVGNVFLLFVASPSQTLSSVVPRSITLVSGQIMNAGQ